MLRKLYDWTLQKSATPAAEVWLAVIAFVESSVFLIPADVLFVPMALAKPAKAYRYALVATLASTLGGIAGYFIGHYAYQEVAKPVLALPEQLPASYWSCTSSFVIYTRAFPSAVNSKFLSCKPQAL